MIKDILRQRLAHKHPFMISHPPGWDDIVERLHNKLIEIEPDYKVVQTKEKFGTLRFYIELPDRNRDLVWDKVYSAISRAEDESARTCDTCGKPGRTRTGSWVRTLCNKCDKNRKNPPDIS